MSDALSQLTVNWEEDGVQKVKEIDKHVLSKGAWATLMFLYQEWDPKEEKYRAPKISIRRYRKAIRSRLSFTKIGFIPINTLQCPFF